MSFWRGYTYFLLVMLALAVGGIIGAAKFFENFTWCSSRIVREFPSQDGREAAIVGVKGCGATGSDTTFVMIRRADKKFDIEGNDYFFAVGDINDIEVVWEEPFRHVGGGGPSNSLTVIYRRPELSFKEMIYRKAIVWDTDRISYRER